MTCISLIQTTATDRREFKKRTFFKPNFAAIPVPEVYLEMLRKVSAKTFTCAGGNPVPLVGPKEHLAEEQQADKRIMVAQMDKSADESRDRATAAMTLRGKTGANDFECLFMLQQLRSGGCNDDSRQFESARYFAVVGCRTDRAWSTVARGT
jgi:hypothetical protein